MRQTQLAFGLDAQRGGKCGSSNIQQHPKMRTLLKFLCVPTTKAIVTSLHCDQNPISMIMQTHFGLLDI